MVRARVMLLLAMAALGESVRAGHELTCDCSSLRLFHVEIR